MPKSQYSIDLIKQMAECDANYIRLLKLLPQLRGYRDKLQSKNSTAKQKQNKVIGDPENVDNLKGENRVFCIADLVDSTEKVTVEIRIIESFKYTTTLEIIQKPKFKKWMTNPTMLVRAYHDASTAEVISYQGHRNLQPRYSQPNPKMYYPDEKRQVNAFLGEWLTHCLRVGQSLKVPDSLFST